MKINKNILYTGMSLGLIMSLNSQVFANAAPAPVDNCCDELSARLKKVEDKAVMSSLNKITMYGALYRAALWLDDGSTSRVTHVDNSVGTSRFNITGTGALTDTLTVKGIFEVGMGSNDSLNQNVVDEGTYLFSESNGDAADGINLRRAEVAFMSPNFGELYMGRGWMSQSGASFEGDMSGTGSHAIGLGAAAYTIGFTQFTVKGATKQTARSGLPVIGVFNPYDILRKDRIRYNTPKFAGFSVNTSHAHQGDGDIFDAALRYSGAFGGTKVAGVVTYLNDRSTAARRYKAMHLNVGALFPVSMTKKEGTGLNVNFAAAKVKTNNVSTKGKILFGKVGMIERFVGVGNTAVAFDYGEYKDMIAGAPKHTAKSWALSMTQNLDAVASELYLNYRNYDLKVTGVPKLNKISTVMLGATVKM